MLPIPIMEIKIGDYPNCSEGRKKYLLTVSIPISDIPTKLAFSLLPLILSEGIGTSSSLLVMESNESCRGPEWSFEQDKAFENALGTYPEDDPDRWEKIAADVIGKTLEEVKQHYELLVDDVNLIESGRVTLPTYNSTLEGSTGNASDEGAGKKGGQP
ncbi:hypothetical protein Ahy_B02g058860 isoform C [Arachis hypogaea]|uniref:Myb-like domain-containing protein n=1 Tax=Arachis hypogaea TaxID=3818 RepID=A0A445AFM8_ARAHY|nr:hypothetical protein Ahy_B02g058860 isoform C [Arachis hypogaea]